MIPCPCTKSKVFCTFCETLTKNTGCFCAECGSHIPYRLIGGGNGSDSGFQRGHHVLFISNKAAGEHRHFGGSAHPAQDLGHGAGQQVQTVRQIWRNLIQAFQCDGIQQEYPQNGGQPKLLGTADEGLPGGDDAVGSVVLRIKSTATSLPASPAIRSTCTAAKRPASWMRRTMEAILQISPYNTNTTRMFSLVSALQSPASSLTAAMTGVS